MGMEVRRVVEGWQHPTRNWLGRPRNKTDRLAYRASDVPWAKGDYEFRPLHDQDWLSAWRSWQWGRIKWCAAKPLWWVATMLGLRCAFDSDGLPRATEESWAQTVGGSPRFLEHRPRWKTKDRTRYQLYENTSEGTPISPVFKSIEQMGAWCASWSGRGKRNVWVGTHDMDAQDWGRVLGNIGVAASFVITPEHGVESGAKHAARQARAEGGAT